MQDTQNFYSGGSTIREVIRATLQNANSISNMQDILQPWNGDFVVNGNITVANQIDTDTLQADTSITTQSLYLGLKDVHNGRLRAVENMELFVESAPGGGNRMLFGKNSFTAGTTIEWDSGGENGQIRFRGSGGNQGTIVSHDSITMRNDNAINTRLTNDSKIILYEDENNSVTMDGSTDELKFTRNEITGDTDMVAMTKDSVTVNSDIYIHDSVVVEGIGNTLHLKGNDGINMYTNSQETGFVSHLIIEKSGNVGIGFNPHPDYLLDVNDNVRVGNKGGDSQLFLGGSPNRGIKSDEAGLGHHEFMSYALKQNRIGRTDIKANLTQTIQMNIGEEDKIRISYDNVTVNSNVFITDRLAIGNVTSPSFIIDTNNIQGDETTFGGDVRFRSTSLYQRIRQGADVDGVGVEMTTLAINGEDGAVVAGHSGEYVNQSNITGDLELRSLNNIRIQTHGQNNRIYITQGGKVGIGTSTPSELLDVNGSLHVSDQILLDNDVINVRPLEVTGNATNLAKFESVRDSSYIEIRNKEGTRALFGCDGSGFGGGDNTSVLLANWTEGDLAFVTNQIKRMTIDKDGKVGIGETNPSGTLNVIPLGSIGGAGNVENAGLVVGTTSDGIGIDTNEITKVGGDFNLAATDGNMRFQTNSGSERMTILANGNVGIGTNNPSKTLDVQGDIFCESLYVDNDLISSGSGDSVNGGLRLSTGLNNEANIYIRNSRSPDVSYISFTTRANGSIIPKESMNITNGNVGIGTSTPSHKLNVIGVANITGGVLPFTGAHVGEISETIENTSVLQLGRIMSIESVSNIDINNNSYVVNVCGDTQIPFGVYSGERSSSPNATTRIIRMNALGEGGVLIRRSTCGDIQAGDYLVSDADGYATKKQDQTIDRFVVGKALCKPNWNDNEEFQLLPVVYLCG